jgi:hypothetical protein
VAARPAVGAFGGADGAGPDRFAGPETAQILGEVPGGGVAPPGGFLQALQADGDQVARQPGPQPRGGQGLFAEQLGDRFRWGVGVKGRPAGQHLVQDRSKSVNVHSPSDALLVQGLFGGHVGGGAQGDAALG